MKFYIDSVNALKLKALEIALINTAVSGEIISVSPTEQIDIRPLCQDDIEKTARRRAGLMAEHLEQRKGYCIGLQKGTTLHDDPRPFFLKCYAVTQHKSMFHYGVSRAIELPLSIKQLVISGTELYDAYEIIFGPQAKNKEWSIYEELTGKPEEKWMAKAIEGSLMPFLGKGAHYF